MAEAPQSKSKSAFPRRLAGVFIPRALPYSERMGLVERITHDSLVSRRFFALLTLSTVIASFGLLANSAAVIIGAMIIAPLMGPIIGLSFGAVTMNATLQRKAVSTEFLGVIWAIGIGALIGLIPFNFGITPEMQARTSPTVFDLCIALASGLAGGYASANQRVNPAIAGVAISVALVPPLACCGLLLALGHYQLALGAALLFLANFFCIQFAAAAVFTLYHLFPKWGPNKVTPWGLLVRFLPTLGVIAVMGWFMTNTLIELSQTNRTEKQIETILQSEIATRTGGRLDSILQQRKEGNEYLVVAAALTPQAFDPTQVTAMENVLRAQIRPDIHLVVRSLISRDIDHSGQVFVSDSEREQSAQQAASTKYLSDVRESLRSDLAVIEGASLVDVQRSEKAGVNELVALVSTPVPINSEDVAQMEDNLHKAIGKNSHLVVRSLITSSSDRDGALYVPELPTNPMSDVDTRLLARVRSSLAQRVRAIPGARLRDLSFHHVDKLLQFNASVDSPIGVTPEMVAQYEADLRKFVNDGIRLSIHTNIQADASSQGWTSPGT